MKLSGKHRNVVVGDKSARFATTTSSMLQSFRTKQTAVTLVCWHGRGHAAAADFLTPKARITNAYSGGPA